MKYLFSFVVVLFASCGDGKKEAAQQMADSTDVAAPSYVVDLAAHDLPLLADLGDLATLGADSAIVKWNEEFGHLAVHAGEHFAITISEAPGDIARLKADLERDMLQKHTVIEETPDQLIYRSQFPDADLVFVHFHQVITVGDRTFVVEDAAEGRFNEADIKRMAAAVKTNTAS
ncbi:MAG TPA: hypothetical protein PLB89_02535 [Flavobacteriales bacterium]|nr:hypothetical protein [Flavobacteriales bacterium]